MDTQIQILCNQFLSTIQELAGFSFWKHRQEGHMDGSSFRERDFVPVPTSSLTPSMAARMIEFRTRLPLLLLRFRYHIFSRFVRDRLYEPADSTKTPLDLVNSLDPSSLSVPWTLFFIRFPITLIFQEFKDSDRIERKDEAPGQWLTGPTFQSFRVGILTWSFMEQRFARFVKSRWDQMKLVEKQASPELSIALVSTPLDAWESLMDTESEEEDQVEAVLRYLMWTLVGDLYAVFSKNQDFPFAESQWKAVCNYVGFMIQLIETDNPDRGALLNPSQQQTFIQPFIKLFSLEDDQLPADLVHRFSIVDLTDAVLQSGPLPVLQQSPPAAYVPTHDILIISLQRVMNHFQQKISTKTQ